MKALKLTIEYGEYVYPETEAPEILATVVTSPEPYLRVEAEKTAEVIWGNMDQVMCAKAIAVLAELLKEMQGEVNG